MRLATYSRGIRVMRAGRPRSGMLWGMRFRWYSLVCWAPRDTLDLHPR